MISPSWYDVLGVPADASSEQLRAAYVARARRLHPDRLLDADPRERAAAQREMQVLNEAWRVLGHPARRRQYDANLARAPHTTDHPGDGPEDGPPGDALPDDETIEWVDPVARLVRVLPWVLILAVLLAIFVFTAYAGGTNP